MKSILEKGNPPAVCAPVTGGTEIDIFEQLKAIIAQEPDIIEWRADFFENLADTSTVLEVIMKMKLRTEIPILFTIRAEREGGEAVTLSEEDKVLLLLSVCEHSEVDMVDYELSNNDQYIQKVREVAKLNRKKLILSYHNFSSTPDESELIEKAKTAEAYEADIAKLAVMPSNKGDVFHLLHITRTIDHLLDIPVVTMAMGDVGALSRIIGWTYGSSMTFGVGVEASAPGQIPVKELNDAIHAIKTLLPAWR